MEYQSSVVSVVQRHLAIFDHPEIPSTVSQFQAGLSSILAELSQWNLYSYVLTTTGVGVHIGESAVGDYPLTIMSLFVESSRSIW